MSKKKRRERVKRLRSTCKVKQWNMEQASVSLLHMSSRADAIGVLLWYVRVGTPAAREAAMAMISVLAADISSEALDTDQSLLEGIVDPPGTSYR
jgi:hypothetical protein